MEVLSSSHDSSTFSKVFSLLLTCRFMPLAGPASLHAAAATSGDGSSNCSAVLAAGLAAAPREAALLQPACGLEIPAAAADAPCPVATLLAPTSKLVRSRLLNRGEGRQEPPRPAGKGDGCSRLRLLLGAPPVNGRQKEKEPNFCHQVVQPDHVPSRKYKENRLRSSC